MILRTLLWAMVERLAALTTEERGAIGWLILGAIIGAILIIVLIVKLLIPGE